MKVTVHGGHGLATVRGTVYGAGMFMGLKDVSNVKGSLKDAGIFEWLFKAITDVSRVFKSAGMSEWYINVERT